MGRLHQGSDRLLQPVSGYSAWIWELQSTHGGFLRCPYVMCGSRVGLWEGHCNTTHFKGSLSLVSLRAPCCSSSVTPPTGWPTSQRWMTQTPLKKALKSDTFPAARPHDLPRTSDAQSIGADGGFFVQCNSRTPHQDHKTASNKTI